MRSPEGARLELRGQSETNGPRRPGRDVRVAVGVEVVVLVEQILDIELRADPGCQVVVKRRVDAGPTG